MKFGDTVLDIGGLMRCCTGTIGEYVHAHEDEEAPDKLVLDCKYEPEGNAQITLEHGVWRWNHPLTSA